MLTLEDAKELRSEVLKDYIGISTKYAIPDIEMLIANAVREGFIEVSYTIYRPTQSTEPYNKLKIAGYCKDIFEERGFTVSEISRDPEDDSVYIVLSGWA